jgi:hypothetical protein
VFPSIPYFNILLYYYSDKNIGTLYYHWIILYWYHYYYCNIEKARTISLIERISIITKYYSYHCSCRTDGRSPLSLLIISACPLPAQGVEKSSRALGFNIDIDTQLASFQRSWKLGHSEAGDSSGGWQAGPSNGWQGTGFVLCITNVYPRYEV